MARWTGSGTPTATRLPLSRCHGEVYGRQVSTELTQLAESKDFDAVLARFREHDRAEVLAAADRLREDDIYNVAIELYQWLLDDTESADAHFGIGQCYGKIYEYDTALAHLDQAFAEDQERSDGASYYAYI